MNAILLALVIFVSLITIYVYYFNKEGFYSLEGKCHGRSEKECENTLDENNNECEYIVDCYDPTDRNPACISIKDKEQCESKDECVVKKYSQRCQIKQDHIEDLIMDNTQDEFFEKNATKDKCTFVPWGPSKKDCINRCASVDRVYWGGDSCLENCEEICGECKDTDKCSWLKDEYKPSLDKIIPDAPESHTMKAFAGNNKILVVWSSIDKKAKNTGFIIQYYKKYKPESGTFSIKVPAKSKKNYKYVIQNLDNNEYYTLILYAVNSFGIGKPSNMMTLVPNENSKIIT